MFEPFSWSYKLNNSWTKPGVAKLNKLTIPASYASDLLIRVSLQ